MKKVLLIAVSMLIGATVVAQDCYQSTRRQGINYYNQGKKKEAKRYFTAAQSCPDKPANNDLQTWIRRCDTTVATGNVFELNGVELVNIELGNEVAESPIFAGDMGNMAPRIDYRGIGKRSQTITLHTKLLDPTGKLVSSGASPLGYTSMRNITVEPGVEGTTYLPALSSYNGGVYTNGVYEYEVWYQGKRLYTRTFVVSATKTLANVTLTVDGQHEVNSFDIPYGGGSESYTINTNASSYDITYKPSWVQLVTKTKNSFKIQIAPNPEGFARTDYITISAAGREVTVNIQQNANPSAKRKTDVTSNGNNSSKKGYDNSGTYFDVGIGLSFSSTAVSFSDATRGGVINYGVNDLADVMTGPDYTSGVGFEMHGNVNIPLSEQFYIVTGLAFSFQNFSASVHTYDWNYTTDGGVNRWAVDQRSDEKYHFTYIDVPLLASYKIPVADNMTIAFKGGFGLGFGLSGKCNVSSHVYAENTTSNQYFEYDLNGDVNLYKGSYHFDQQYTTGAASLYEIDNVALRIFNSFNLTLRLGADFELNRFVIGLSYNIGLSNLANRTYFEDVSIQVPGFYIVGSRPGFVNTTYPLYSYKQRLSSFMITVGYKF